MNHRLGDTERLILAETDSTNAEARRRAEAGGQGPLWLLAHRQTAGRGRDGRAWQSDAGNFAASLLLPFRGTPIEAASCLVQTAALATAEICDACGDAQVSIKWPNDVLVNGKKAAGILIENLGPRAAPGTLTVILGIGINLRHAPPADETRWPATSLFAEGLAPGAPEAVLDHLAQRVAHWLGADSQQRLAAWRQRLHGIGQPIEARLPGRSLHGIFDGVDASGLLVLRTPGGVERISAADVYFPETC